MLHRVVYLSTVMIYPLHQRCKPLDIQAERNVMTVFTCLKLSSTNCCNIQKVFTLHVFYVFQIIMRIMTFFFFLNHFNLA
jgi:hypothetical protein